MSDDNKNKQGFKDGIKNFMSQLIASRNPMANNTVQVDRLSDVTLREIYRLGVANKIVRIKAGDALKDTLQFENTEDEAFYKARLQKKVKQAAKWMIAFGRGIIVIHNRGDILNTKLLERDIDPDNMMLSVFSGDMVTANGHITDLQHPRYYKPEYYQVRGESIHYSRVIDFTYIEPPELDKPQYHYGGVSEFELIYEQLIADGIVQRSSPRIIEKASTIFYKIKGFKDAMRNKQEKEMVEYFSRMENLRGINAAGLIDMEDEVEAIQQTISNLAEADQITLRRLAMVTGISITRLVGENVKGLNSSGDNEAQMDQDMIENVQEDYLYEPINDLMGKLGKGEASFKENQGETPKDRIDYEGKAVEIAAKLWEMGEDHRGYLEEKDVLQKDDFTKMFPPARASANLPSAEDVEPGNDDTEADDNLAVDPSSALNGAQVTALMEVISRIKSGEITKDTGIKIIGTAFPLSGEEAASLVRDVQEGVTTDEA